MTVNKRKKFSRQRGRHTHGWGSKKKHRGAGNRGGKGMAGTGKRGDSIKTLIWKNKKYFGKYGFTSKSVVKINAVNIDYVEEKLSSKDGGVIDLGKLGYNKLLGKGQIKNKLKIKVDMASAKAIDKIKKAGGEVILGKSKEVKSAE